MKRSINGVASTEPAFKELTKSCTQRKLPVDNWYKEEAHAMENRGECLGIFDIWNKKAPTLAQITLQMMNTKENPKVAANIVDWISDGIKAQNNQ